MQSMPDLDVIIIGAGAAGIGAARCLAGAKLRCCVIEARERPGGRAHTIIAGNYPLDLGCGWLHSANRNPFVPVAERFGLVIDKTLPPWERTSEYRGLSTPELAAFGRAQEEFFERLAVAAQAARQTGIDRRASEFLEPGLRWNPVIDAISTWYNGSELDSVSVLDFDDYVDTNVNWRVPAGYGTLVSLNASGLDVRFSCPVHRIDRSGPDLRVESTQGTISAGAVIVTVPTNLIADGALAFHPALPEKTDAAASLPLGLADKLFLAVDHSEDLPDDGRLFGRSDRVDMASYHLRPFRRPMIEAYFGGRFAASLEQEGERAFADYAIADLCGHFGSAFRRRVTPLAVSGWARDPFARGSYSHALPGATEARARLAAPVDGRLFFAGEACSPASFSTAHGAWESGRSAAEALLQLRKS